VDAWTIGSLLETATGYLREKGSGSPRLDAELLLAEALGLDRIHLYTHHDRPLSSCEVDHYRTLVARRAQHEPVACILGRAHFRRLTLEVTPAVLIPRPETEELVDLALETLRLRPAWEAYENEGDGAVDRAAGSLIADVGTGSGVIALSLAQETGLSVLATDSSPAALAVAERNRAAAGLDGLVELRAVDLLTGVPEHTLRLVVSNPPYVTSVEMEELAPDVRLFEPPAALHGGLDGLDVYRRLLPDAARALLPGGSLLVEVGHQQAERVAALAQEAGFALAATRKDLSGKRRFVSSTMPGAPVRDPDLLDEATLGSLAEALRAGATIGLPTDTVYGLAARWDSGPGVRRLFAAKGRDFTQPVSAMFPSVEAVAEALPDLEPSARAVLAALLPGPYTFIVSTAVPRPALVGTEDSLGIRVPDHPAVLRLLSRLGTGVVATSANRSGEKEAATLAEVELGLLAHCSLALSDPSPASAPARPAKPSTVVDLRPLASGERPLVLREGAVAAAVVLERIAAL
jgi:release factor glutamine methyltransferase